jgi:hypothetical protein
MFLLCLQSAPHLPAEALAKDGPQYVLNKEYSIQVGKYTQDFHSEKILSVFIGFAVYSP